MNTVQDGEPDAGQFNTTEPPNQAGKPVQEGTVLGDADPEYVDDKDSVWGEDANDTTA